MTTADSDQHAPDPRHTPRDRPDPEITAASPALRAYLGVEFFVVFALVPMALQFGPIRVPLIPFLFLSSIALFIWLWVDKSFDRRRLWRWTGIAESWRSILGLWLASAAVITAVVLIWRPDLFLSFPREKTIVWIIVMLAYPIASVYPQEIIFRAFLFHRYRALFTKPWLMVIMSAIVFGWGHIVMGHWLSIVLSMLLGVVLAWRYLKTRSLAAVCLEHAIYGQLIFTIGLGTFFYDREGDQNADPRDAPVPAQVEQAVENSGSPDTISDKHKDARP